ncbi:MAG: tRNA epoxyqueuosine(34) reductase QueG, partial [Burkholderiales bacterium]
MEPAAQLPEFKALAAQIKVWGGDLGFHQVGISNTDLSTAETRLLEWLAKGFHGGMDYMAKHGVKRSRPPELAPGTLSVISLRMNYLPATARACQEVLRQPDKAYISRYALGRDYHRVMRSRLRKLADKVQARIGRFNYRAFTDSAPVMEVELARKAGLGWRGKHTLLLSRDAGSWFFLGEIYTDLPLPADVPQHDHCGRCEACIDVCPTRAIVAPYQLDARRCISYLTIEHSGSIPVELRPLIGNRVYGCDDCQLVCPWNRFARLATDEDFAQVRNGLDASSLLELFSWSEDEFLRKLQGSAIRRIGYARWLRNLAVGLGNAPRSPQVIAGLRVRANDDSA